ncbi:MAG: hypothetical protein ACE37D_13295 [Pseudomonadales bacterium]
MIDYVIRARKAPTDPVRFLGQAGQEAHTEYLCQILVNGLLISQGHRDDVRLSFVLEASADFSRVITFDGSVLGSLDDWSEAGILQLFARCLQVSVGAAKSESREVLPGVTVTAASVEEFLKSFAGRQIYLMDRKGVDIRAAALEQDAVFVLTDHIPMPTKQAKSLVNRGAKPISLGRTMLHASQCVVLIQHEYDRMG